METRKLTESTFEVTVSDPKTEVYEVSDLQRRRDAYVSKRAVVVANYPVELARIDAEIAKLNALLGEAIKLGVTAAKVVEPVPVKPVPVPAEPKLLEVG